MLTATLRRERSTNTPGLYFPDGTCFHLADQHCQYTRAYMHTRTRPAEPTDPDCVALVAAYPEPLRIVRRLPRHE